MADDPWFSPYVDYLLQMEQSGMAALGLNSLPRTGELLL